MKTLLLPASGYSSRGGFLFIFKSCFMRVCFNHGIIKYNVSYVNMLYLKCYDRCNQNSLHIKRK